MIRMDKSTGQQGLKLIRVPFCFSKHILCIFQKFWNYLFPSKGVDHYTDKTSWIAVVIGIFFSLMSVSRIIALYQGNC